MKEAVEKALEAIGIDVKEVQLQNVKEDSLTLRYGYWKWLPENKGAELIEALGDAYTVTPDTYVDDDGEDDEGRTMYRYLHSYIIKKVF